MRIPKPPIVAAALGALAGTAMADTSPITMTSHASVRTCLVGCTSSSAFTLDSHSVDAGFANFTNLDVSAHVAAGGNAYEGLASATTTLLSDNTGFVVHLVVDRPDPSLTIGTNEIRAGLDFGFGVDGAGGTLSIAYQATYGRSTTGPSISTGVSFSTPQILVFTGAHSVPATSFNSVSGASSGIWDYALTPNGFYSLSLDATNSISFSAPLGMPIDLIDVTYTVTLPPFATSAVPEPPPAALAVAGLAIGALLRRRRAPAG